jgi:hypothetical protein
VSPQVGSYVVVSEDYDGDAGGGSTVLTGWTIGATDCRGNGIQRLVSDTAHVTQEDGTATAGGSGPVPQVTYTGSWTTSSCQCFLFGRTRRTSSSGARVTLTANFPEGSHLALVRAKGPGRGRAAIRLDGTIITTIDTFAPTNANRVVVFDRLMPAGTHSISITNLATSGRPRVDLDAIMTN